MNALNDFVVAAGSYFGLPEGRVMQGSTLDVGNGELELVLRIVLTSDDTVGIGKRMGVMLTEKATDEAVAARRATEAPAFVMPTNDELRALWDALDKTERSKHGSFGKFKAQWMSAPEADKVELPAYVWLDPGEETPYQASMHMGVDMSGRIAVDPGDLTSEQKAKRGIP